MQLSDDNFGQVESVAGRTLSPTIALLVPSINILISLTTIRNSLYHSYICPVSSVW